MCVCVCVCTCVFVCRGVCSTCKRGHKNSHTHAHTHTMYTCTMYMYVAAITNQPIYMYSMTLRPLQLFLIIIMYVRVACQEVGGGCVCGRHDRSPAQSIMERIHFYRIINNYC